MEFVSHYQLYLLLLIPVFIFGKLIISKELQLKYFLLSLSFAFAVFANAAPYYRTQQPMRKLLFLFDISRSVTVTDMMDENGKPVSRLDYAKDKLAKAVPFLPPGTLVGVGATITSFTDYSTDANIKIFWPLQELTEKNTGAFYKALRIVDWWNAWGDKSEWPPFLFSLAWLLENKLGRDLNIIVISDGGSEIGQDFGSAKVVIDAIAIFKSYGARFIYLGVGGDASGKVPEFGADLKPTGKCFVWSEGKCFQSRLEEDNLRRIAALTGGKYLRLKSPGDFMSVVNNPQNRVFGYANAQVSADGKFLLLALLFLALFIVL